jgi:YD repeat-containing protein
VRYAFSPVSASLLLTDTPVGYAPPRGPAVFGTVRYDYRQTLEPQMPTFSHVGPRWTFGWVAYAAETPESVAVGGGSGALPAHVSVHLREGGEEVFMGAPADGVYPRHWRTRAQLVRVSADPIQYERRMPDGTIEVYGLADAAPAGSRRVFLTAVRDAHGATVALTYDSQFRLVALTDALGQVTTLGYTHASDPLLITRVTDPFGRTATFTYTAAGQLATITDVMGLTSHVAYGAGDFVTALTTPYGTTTFRHEADGDGAWNPLIEATDPTGGTERLQFETLSAGAPASEPAGTVPAGFASRNTALNGFSTRYWAPAAWAAAPGDPAAATVTHWLLSAWAPEAQPLSVAVPHSVVRPGAGRVWYAYPGQGTSGSGLTEVGTFRQPAITARVLPDGTTQATQATYNDLGQVTSRTDALGRTTTSTYAANDRDLLAVRQGSGPGDLVATYGNYTAGGQPQTVTDAAGQGTTLMYTSAGQVQTVTNPRDETTTYGYDTQGYLTSVTGPVAGAATTYTYDGYGRVRAVTTDGATITTDYDALDRVTRVTYPDGTVEATTYDRLDVGTRTDRLGRVTRFWYDGARRRVATRDPAGRVIGHASGAGRGGAGRRGRRAVA